MDELPTTIKQSLALQADNIYELSIHLHMLKLMVLENNIDELINQNDNVK